MNRYVVNFLVGVMLMVVLFACDDHHVISIQASPDKLTLENREINKIDFEEELKLVVDNKLQQGVERKDMIVNLTVDEQTLRGDIADIEVSLRKLDLKRVRYSTY